MLQGREDIKSLLSQWSGRDGILPKSITRNMVADAEKKYPNLDGFNRYSNSRIVMAVSDALKLHESFRET